MYNDEHILTDEQINKLSEEYEKNIKVSVYQNEPQKNLSFVFEKSPEILFYIDSLANFTNRKRVKDTLFRVYNKYSSLTKTQKTSYSTPTRGSFNKKLFQIMDALLQQISKASNSDILKELTQIFGELLALYNLSLF